MLAHLQDRGFENCPTYSPGRQGLYQNLAFLKGLSIFNNQSLIYSGKIDPNQVISYSMPKIKFIA